MPLREVRGDERQVDGSGNGDGSGHVLHVFGPSGMAPGVEPQSGEPAGAVARDVPSADGVSGPASLADVVDRGIAAAVAAFPGAGSWQSPTWELVSRLRRHPATWDLDADEAADLVESIRPEVWSELPAHDSMGNPCDPAEDFPRAWDRCRGGSALERAMLAVDGAPIPSEEFGGGWVSHRRRAGFRRFLAVARELTRIAEGGPIVLAVEGIAAALGVDRHAVGEYRRRAVELGYLVETAAADRRNRRAAEYRWLHPW